MMSKEAEQKLKEVRKELLKQEGVLLSDASYNDKQAVITKLLNMLER